MIPIVLWCWRQVHFRSFNEQCVCKGRNPDKPLHRSVMITFNKETGEFRIQYQGFIIRMEPKMVPILVQSWCLTRPVMTSPDGSPIPPPQDDLSEIKKHVRKVSEKCPDCGEERPVHRFQTFSVIVRHPECLHDSTEATNGDIPPNESISEDTESDPNRCPYCDAGMSVETYENGTSFARCHQCSYDTIVSGNGEIVYERLPRAFRDPSSDTVFVRHDQKH